MDVEAILGFFQQYGYLALFLGLLACGLGLPIPEEIFLIGAGILVYLGETDFYLTTAVAMGSILFGDSLAYFLGYFHGHRIYRWKPMQKILGGSEKKQSWVQSHFDNHPLKTIFVARFLTGVRAPTYFFAGSHDVPYWKFLLMDGLGALVGVPTVIWISWKLGQNIKEAEDGVQSFNYIILALLGVALIVGVIYYLCRKKDPVDSPSNKDKHPGTSPSPQG